MAQREIKHIQIESFCQFKELKQKQVVLNSGRTQFWSAVSGKPIKVGLSGCKVAFNIVRSTACPLQKQ